MPIRKLPKIPKRDVYDDWPEELDPELVMPPPLGVLSRGPVWGGCPKLTYANLQGRLPTIFNILSLEECEELVDFLCGLDKVCQVDNCEFMTPDYYRSEFIWVAAAHGDGELARKHRDLITDPSLVDPGFEAFLARHERRRRRPQTKR